MRLLRHIAGTTHNLSKNGPFQFACRHALEVYPSGAIYTFIPKNACSTMRYTIARANGMIDSEADIHWIHANNQTFNPDLKSLATADYTFVILRCPYARLASVFLDKFVGQTPDAYQYYNATRRVTPPLDLTFRGFVQSLSRPQVLKANIHWRPQVDFLIYVTYDDYFCMEDFDNIVTTLADKIGLAVCDARHLTGHGIDGYRLVREGEVHSDLPVADLISLKRAHEVVPPASLYDDELYERVTALYAQDIVCYEQHFGRDRLMTR